MTSRRLPWLVGQLMVALLAGALGCAGSRISDEPGAAEESGASVVEVRNNHLYGVDVYHVRSGVRFRLGTVPTQRSARFPMPDAVSVGGTLELFVESVGTDATYSTGQILLGGGQSVILNLAGRLAASSYSLRNR